MEIEKAVQKALEELKIERVYLEHHKKTLERYLVMMYSIGYDTGRKLHSNQKKVLQMDKWGNKIEEFPSAAEASRITHVSKTGIKDCCNGKHNMAKGYHWKYADTDIKLKERKTA